MSAIICFPSNSGGLPNARIYRAEADSINLDPFELLDTVDARQMEYEDPDGNYSNLYKVSFCTNDDDETEKVSVTSVAQNVLSVIRSELDIKDTTISSSQVDVLIAQAKIDVQKDICKFNYGFEVKKLDDLHYQLPKRFYYDLNCGGVVSVLDFTFFKQRTPLTVYTPKIPVIPAYVDPNEYYVELKEPLEHNDILKFNFYTISRDIPSAALWRLIAFKICSMHYYNISVSNSISNFSSIKVGEISISTRNSNSSGTTNTQIDAATKMEAKYRNLVTGLQSQFARVN